MCIVGGMPGRPREFDKGEALDAAVECFWARGYEASSVADLLKEMGINRQSAYDTFGDKRSLFLQALSAYADRVGAEMTRILGHGHSPLARVRRFLHALPERAAANGSKGCLLVNTVTELAPHDPEVRAFTAAVFARLEHKIAATLTEAKAAGELRDGAKPRQLARFLVTVMQGALVAAKTGNVAAVRDAARVAEEVLTRD
jgi:TetR/AcrR family transcriptional regulator, transcriptional repressor for nem operon